MDKKIVVKSNKIIEASYELSLVEQRILVMAISSLDSRQAITANREYSVSSKEYSELFGIDKANAYRDIKKAADSFYERSVIISEPDVKRSRAFTKTRWVTHVTYEPGGVISFMFAPKMIPYISELKSSFTKYYLADVVGMRSQYSLRIYEMIIQWRNTHRVELSVNELKERLCLQADYARVRDFRQRVLDPAIKDINSASNYIVKYKPKKSGRSITSFIFTFDSKASIEGIVEKPEKKTRPPVNDYVRDNPEKTLRKSLDEVLKLMKEEYG